MMNKISNKKIPLWSKIFLANIIVYAILGILYYYFINPDIKTYENPRDYKQALKTFHYPPKNIAHFPHEIPDDAENIIFYSDPDVIFGHYLIYLKFDADSDYIKKEGGRIKYKRTEGPFQDKQQYDSDVKIGFVLLYVFNKIDIKNYKLYIIHDRDDKNKDKSNAEYGFGVNYETNSIIYFSCQ